MSSPKLTETGSENDALFGATGFVGSSLLRQRPFGHTFHTRNVADAEGRTFALCVCAAAPGLKWRANKFPNDDRRSIESLMARLDTVVCQHFVLISTVDVFVCPDGVDEDSTVSTASLPPYGSHRRALEEFVSRRFPARSTIVRLPGLVGPGLRKNFIFDLQHGGDVSKVDARSVYQFYPTVNLWSDVEVAIANALPLVHLTAAPLTAGAVAQHVFGKSLSALDSAQASTPPRYDMQTRHAALFGGTGRYQYDARTSLLALRSYRQSHLAQAGP